MQSAYMQPVLNLNGESSNSILPLLEKRFMYIYTGWTSVGTLLCYGENGKGQKRNTTRQVGGGGDTRRKENAKARHQGMRAGGMGSIASPIRDEDTAEVL